MHNRMAFVVDLILLLGMGANTRCTAVRRITMMERLPGMGPIKFVFHDVKHDIEVIVYQLRK